MKEGWILFSGLLRAYVVDHDKLLCSVPWATVLCSLMPLLCSTKLPGSEFSSSKADHKIPRSAGCVLLAEGRTLPGGHNSVQN